MKFKKIKNWRFIKIEHFEEYSKKYDITLAYRGYVAVIATNYLTDDSTISDDGIHSITLYTSDWDYLQCHENISTYNVLSALKNFKIYVDLVYIQKELLNNIN